MSIFPTQNKIDKSFSVISDPDKAIKKRTIVIGVETDPKSIQAVEGIIEYLNSYIVALPKKKIPSSDISAGNIFLESLIKNKKVISRFISDVKKQIPIDLIIESKDVCIMLDKLTLAQKLTDFLVDFYTEAIGVSTSKEEMEALEVFSYEQLINKFNLTTNASIQV